LAWEAPAAPSFVGAAATRTSSTQTINHATTTVVTLPTENYDTNSFHDTSTNTSRLTIPAGKGGKYHFELAVSFNVFVIDTLYLGLQKNGAAVGEGLANGYLEIIFDSTTSIFGSCDFEAAAGDYFEMFVYQESAGASKALSGARFSCTYLGA
jgi:hypothetical protein